MFHMDDKIMGLNLTIPVPSSNQGDEVHIPYRESLGVILFLVQRA